MNPFKNLKYQLYLLQLENYEIGRYWRLLLNKGFFKPKEPLRKGLVWTAKAKVIFLLSAILWLAISLVFLPFDFYSLIAMLLLLLLFPVFYTLALIILLPIDYCLKIYLIGKTKNIITKADNLKIIGIAGSYGKTTMKAVLASVLSQKYKVLATPESVNTPVGVASWFLKNYKKETQILIIEMGEHYRGDINYLCSITPPDIAVITGINEAHLERLKNIETTASTIFELVDNIKPDGRVVLNSDDKIVKSSYEKFTKGREVTFYSTHDQEISSKKFDTKELAWQFDFGKIENLTVPILGEYILGDTVAAYQIAESLGMTGAEIKKGLLGIKPVEHRLQPIKGEGNVLVIDDSYNGNFDGVKEAIKTLSRFSDRRKVFITPGLVESGEKNEAIHRDIGKELAEAADKVILIRNSSTPYIAEGLREGGFGLENIIWFENAEVAHKSLSKILQPGDVILFQNDWGDQYL